MRAKKQVFYTVMPIERELGGSFQIILKYDTREKAKWHNTGTRIQW